MPYQHRVIISRPWSLHAAKRNALDSRHETTFSNKPIRLFGICILSHLFHHDTENIGNVFVQGARFSTVIKLTVERRHSVLGIVVSG